MSTRDDKALMRLVADGDAAAFEQIYRRHADQVIRTATRRCTDPHEVADVLADTFFAVWRNARGYDAAKGSPAQWISGIAARCFYDLRRSDRRRRALRERVTGRADIHAADIDELVEQIDAERAADAAGLAIGRLPDRQRLVFELVAIDGLSVTATAEALGMTSSAVSMRLSRARRTLQLDRDLNAYTSIGPACIEQATLGAPGGDT